MATMEQRSPQKNILEVQIPNGPTVEIDIGDVGPDDPRINAILQRVQREHMPTPFQQLYDAASGPASAVRDVATQGAGHAMDVMSRMSPEGVSLQAPPMQPQVSAPMAQNIAQQVVPQTPGQFVSTAILAALAGPAAGAGASGALSRAILPAFGEQVVNTLIGEGVDPQMALAQIIPSLMTEGAWGLIPKLKTFHIRGAARDKLGVEMARSIGGELDKITSVKGLRTPEDFRGVMAGMGTASETPGDTIFAKRMSETIGEAQKTIRQQIIPSIRDMDAGVKVHAMSALEEVAGMSPTFRKSLTTIHGPGKMDRVFPDPPDVLFEKGIGRLRQKFQAADSLEGAERFAAFEEYGKMRQQMETALNSINPALAQQYDAMNRQFAVDYDIRNFLWNMKKKGAWETSSQGTHFNVSAAAEVLQDADRLLDETGLFGGADRAMRFIAGPGGVPGARPVLHEGYARLFATLPLLPAAASMAQQPQLIRMPQGPVSTARARALSDFMASQTGQWGMTPQPLQPMGGVQ